MKLLFLTTAYAPYLKAHPLNVVPSGMTYEERERQFFYDAFGWSNFWSSVLKPLGYECQHITINAAFLQKAWALEKGLNIPSEEWQPVIAFEQVKRFQPDVLFLEDTAALSWEWLKEVRSVVPSIKAVLGWCGAPVSNRPIFKGIDLIFSCIPELVAHFRGLGLRSVHMNHMFSPRVLDRVTVRGPKKDAFTFVGQIVRANQYHGEREKLLLELARATPIAIYSPSFDYCQQATATRWLANAALYFGVQGIKWIPGFSSLEKAVPFLKHYARLESMPRPAVNRALCPFMKAPVFGLRMYQTLAESGVTLNHHIDLSRGSASNMRLFEATGVGTCLLTDTKDNLKTLFEVDQEVVTYKTTEECLEKSQWLIEHPAEAAKIAAAGQKRCLKDHTFENRAPQLHSEIQKFFRT